MAKVLGITTHFEIERDGKKVTGHIIVESEGIDVYFDGYGNLACEDFAGLYIEPGDDGHPVVHAWADKSVEDATHRISFAKAVDRLPVGTTLRPKFRTLVDMDDDDRERYVDRNDEGTIDLHNTDSEGKFVNYGVGFPRNGAFGFYDAEELTKYFEIVDGA